MELSFVPIAPDEGQIVSEKQWDLFKDAQQVRVRLQVCQAPCPVLFASPANGPGLSLGQRHMKQELTALFPP